MFKRCTMPNRGRGGGLHGREARCRVHDPAVHAGEGMEAPLPQLGSHCGVSRPEGKLPGKVDVGQDEVRDEAARCLPAPVQALPERQPAEPRTPDAVGLIRPLFAREALRLEPG